MRQRLFGLMTAVVLCSSLSSGTEDVLHLKDGSMVHGTIVEIARDSTIRMRMSDGSVRLYLMTAVENIEEEPGLLSADESAPGDLDTSAFSVVYYGAVSIPTEDFAATSGSKSAAAQTGFGLGVDVRYAFTASYGWMGSLAFSFNGMTQNSSIRSNDITTSTDSWVFLYALNGLKVTGSVSPGFDMFLFGQVGLFRGTIPTIIITNGTNRVSQQEASAASFAYGYGVGLRMRHFELCVRYLAGEPEYNITVSDIGFTTTRKYTQPISCIFITGGYRF